MTNQRFLLANAPTAVSIIASFAVALATLCRSAHAQELAHPAHLVGHEESALLLRVQEVIDDWDPRKLENPYVETTRVVQPDGTIRVSKQLKRADLAAFIADVEAAEALGKAFFWEMQAGSDFRRTADGTYIGTACATCHYKFGADARTRNTVRIPYFAWDKYNRDPHHPLEFGEEPLAYEIEKLATKDLNPLDYQHGGPFSLIVGSQGVEPRVFKALNAQSETDTSGAWDSEASHLRPVIDKTGWSKPEWAMFYRQHTHTSDFVSRQITNRNSPSVINAVFADRLFHDGRAESTFNGFSIFGDSDPREVIHRRHDYVEFDVQGNPVNKSNVVHVKVAITKAALASQAVGPIVNEIEMSYLGRTFPNLAKKLLDREVLKYQTVGEHDSVFAPLDWRLEKEFGAGCKLSGAAGRKSYTYRALIQRAFKPEWWNWGELDVPLVLLRSAKEDGQPQGHLMEANFSLYWGLSLMLYQASLVSNQSPFDEMMRGNSQAVEKKWALVKDQIGEVYLDRSPREKQMPHPNGTSVFQHGFRVFLDRGCIECHSGPLMSELYERKPEDVPLPIGYTLERVLLPNSRADAIALVKQDMHDQLIDRVSNALVSAKLAVGTRVKAVALELDLLRDRAEKDPLKLKQLIKDHLSPVANGSDLEKLAENLANQFIEFEAKVAGPLGNRSFFTEADRIALAEQLGDPVLVERMVIPPKLQGLRPQFPIVGIKEAGYAFYDLGFYNLGVAPPRYDRGIGDSSIVIEAEPIHAAINLLSTSSDRMERAAAQNLRALAKDAKSVDEVVAKSNETDAASLQKALAAVQDLQRELRKRSPQSSSPGSAYQFKREWYRDDFKSPKQIQSPSTPRSAALAPPSTSARSVSEGSKADLDSEYWSNGPYRDTSWDRIDIDEKTRRANLRFKSRARELVTDETAWGYRKPLMHDNELAFWGSFKTPTLRNVELTAPYMHNGRLMTLRDVIEFYDRDGDELAEEPEDSPDPLNFIPRDKAANPDVHPAMVGLHMTVSDRRALEFFLRCLTDERLILEQSPFDHPSLKLADGYIEDPGKVLRERLLSTAGGD